MIPVARKRCQHRPEDRLPAETVAPSARRMRSIAGMDELDAIARTEIQPGWEVLDADDERIGEVSEVHETSFSVTTTVGTTVQVDFTDVESADDGRVILMVSGGELAVSGE
jgi:hypothetical protein